MPEVMWLVVELTGDTVSSETADSSMIFVEIFTKSTQPTGRCLLSSNIERYSDTRPAE